MKIFGIPIFGVILPFVGFRRIYLNSDGSMVDTGKVDAADEYGPNYVEPFVFEWLGFGLPLPLKCQVYETATGLPVR